MFKGHSRTEFIGHLQRLGLVLFGIVVLLAGVRTAAAFNLLKPSPNLLANLAGYWKLDNSTADSSGNGLTLTATNVTGITGPTGAANTAYAFNGTSSKLTVPDSPLINTATSYTEKTISLWFKANNVTSRQMLWEQGNGSDGITMYLYNGCLTVSAVGNGGGYWNASAYKCSIVAGQWYSVVFTIKASIATKLYINGASADECTSKCGSPGAILAHSGVTGIGFATGSLYYADPNSFVVTEDVGAGNYFFNGSIAEVRTYNRALTAGDAQMIANYRPAPLKLGVGLKGLVGHWDMNGSTKDKTPNGNVATVNSATPIADRMGRANSAYSFTGASTSNLTVPASVSSSLDVSGNAITVSAWVRMTSSNANTKGILGRWRAGTAQHYGLQVSSTNTVQFHVDGNNDASIGEVTSSSTLDTTAWHHIVGRYDGSTVKVYIDGVERGSVAWTGAIQSGAEPFYIGARADASGFPGYIDDVRIYNRALSAAEITTHYGQYDSILKYSDLMKGQVADWNLNSNTVDATPYANNGVGIGLVTAADRMGKAGSAYIFDGSTTRYITISNSASLQLTGDMTASMWIRSGPTAGVNRVLLSKGGAHEFEVGMDTSTGGQKLYWRSTGSTAVQFNGVITSASAWVHIVLTVNGTTLTLYKDGTQVGVATIGAGRTASSNAVRIGARPDGTMLAPATIDDVRLWNRALSAAEVSLLNKTYR